MPWYCATTHRKAELIARMHLSDQGFETFLPMRAGRDPKLGLVTRALIPGYIFVALDLSGKRWRAVNSTRGIGHLLPLHLEEPEPVPDRAMALFREHADREGLYDDPADFDRALYAAGTELRVIDGSSAGLSGPVISDEGTRIRILLSMFGREIRATVRPHQVEILACAP